MPICLHLLSNKLKQIQKMNKVLLLGLAVVLFLSACKTTKQQAQSEYTTDNTAQPKVFTVPPSEPKAEVKKVETVPAEKPIAMRKEQVTFTQQSDKNSNESNTFFVILGSFGQLSNAKNFRETLLNEGFTPIILHSESGLYRVCVNSFKSENEARSRVTQLRQAFPKYSDVWLLIKE